MWLIAIELCQGHKNEWNNGTSHFTIFLPSSYQNLTCEVEIKIFQPILEHISQGWIKLKVVNFTSEFLGRSVSPYKGHVAISGCVFICHN